MTKFLLPLLLVLATPAFAGGLSQPLRAALPRAAGASAVSVATARALTERDFPTRTHAGVLEVEVGMHLPLRARSRFE